MKKSACAGRLTPRFRFLVIAALAALLLAPAPAAANTAEAANTVFVIANLHSIGGGTWPLVIYTPSGLQLFYTELLEPDNRNGGPIGLGVSIDQAKLFVTYEDSDKVDIINARTAERLGMVQLGGTADLSGVTVLDDRDEFFVVDRRGAVMHGFSTVTHERLDRWALPNGQGTWDIEAKEDVGGVDAIFVTDGTPIVRWYDVDTHEQLGMAVFSYNAIGLGVDNSGEAPVVFTVAYDPGHDDVYPVAHQYLQKFDVATQQETRREMTSGGRGVAVNERDQVVYVTEGSDGFSDSTVRVYYENNLVEIGQMPLNFCGGGLFGQCTPTDVVSTSLAYGSKLEKKLTSHSSGRMDIGDEAIFTITVTNESFGPIHKLPLQDEYRPSDLAFTYAEPASDDIVDDGTINWSDLVASFGTDLAPEQTFEVKVHFTVQENVCVGYLLGQNTAEMIGTQTTDGRFLPDSQAVEDYRIKCTQPVEDDDASSDDTISPDAPIDQGSPDEGWPKGVVTGGCCGC